MANNDVPAANEDARSKIAVRLVLFCAGGVTVLSAIVLIGAAFDQAYPIGDATQLVFASVLPLLGTWVGTVLAYYFSKDNFEAASKSVQDLVKLTTEERLKTLFVRDEMIDFGSMAYLQLTVSKPADQWSIEDLQGMLTDKITRIPVLDQNRHVLHVIHDSVIFRFIAKESLKLAAASPPSHFDPKTKTLQDFLNDAELNQIVTDSRAFIELDATLAKAKAAMEAKEGCLDVFVTRNGSAPEPVEGWITNKRIMKHAKAPA